MKKALFAAMLTAGICVTAQAIEASDVSIGAGYGFSNGGVYSVHGDVDISSLAHNQPITVRVAYEHYSNDVYSFKWSYNVFSAGAYYDFNKLAHLNSKLHPFAGAGYGFGSVSCDSCTYSYSSPAVGGVYFIGGIQYNVMPHMTVEAAIKSDSGAGTGAGPIAGINYKF